MLHKSKPVSTLFILVMYMSGIFSPHIINAMHEIHHVMEHMFHLHLEHEHIRSEQDTRRAHIHNEFKDHGHSHGQLMDKALQLVNDSDEQEHESNYMLLVNRIFDHLTNQEPLWLVSLNNKGSKWTRGHSKQTSQTELSPETPPPKPYSIHTLTS